MNSIERRKKYTIASVGEILWDMFPDGKQIGGAPTNFAYHVSSLGHRGIIASRIGKDTLGKEIFNYLKNFSLSKEYIQIDPVHPTGTADVKIDKKEYPEYTIKQNVAWDFFEFDRKWKKLAKKADAIYFCTLSQRSPESYMAIKEFLKNARKDAVKIFDINLRQDFFSRRIITESLEETSILKLNEEELPILIDLVGFQKNNSHEEDCMALIKEYNLDLVCVTKGKNGSLLITEKEIVRHNGFVANVVDTVGAGDAFTAALVVKYLERKSLHEMSETANKLGSWVSSQVGGMPPVNKEILRELL